MEFLKRCSLLFFLVIFLAGFAFGNSSRSSEKYLSQLDELSALWSFYKFTYIQEGRVVSHDENRITTSEGQSYALLRAVWQNDHEVFKRVWHWTKKHLQVRSEDKLFSWKWRN